MGLMARRTAIVVLAASGASCALFTSPSEGRSGPCPAGMAYVTLDSTPTRSYCIDKWEGSVVEIRGNKEVPHTPYEPVTNLQVKAVSKAGVVPQGYISK